MAKEKPLSERQAAEAEFHALVAERDRVRVDVLAARRAAAAAGAEADEAADSREDLLAAGDEKGAEAARVSASEAAGRVNVETTRLRGLVRRIEDLERQIPEAALEAATAVLEEYDARLLEARAAMDEQPSAETVAVFVDAYRERYSLAQELHRVTADVRRAPGSFDLRPELARRNLLSLAPDFVAYMAAKPALREEWRPTLGAALEDYRVRREQAARTAVPPPRREVNPMAPLGME